MSDPSRADLALLQGAWTQIAMEENGIADPPDTHGAPGAITRFIGHHFSVTTAEGTILLEGRFELDATTTPKSITWIDAIGPDANKRLPASYRLDQTHFIFIAGDEGAKRPIEFKTSQGQTMRSFLRIK